MVRMTRWIPTLVLAGLFWAGAGAYPALAQDSEAEEVYDAAHDALLDDEWKEARRLFRRVHEDFQSDFGPEALYWEAFALYRMGGNENLRQARDLLQLQAEEHPEAVTRKEAKLLATRIDGKLARSGDAVAAEDVVRRAEGDDDDREEDDDIRITALNALLQMDAERAVPILRRILEKRDEDSAELRAKAVFILSQHGEDEAGDLLLDVVRNDPDLEVRSQAVFWLSQVSGEKALVALEEILADPEYPAEIQDKAVFAVSQHSSPRAMQILRNVAADESRDEEIRGNALFWLGQQGGRESAGFLWDLFGTMESNELKDKIVFSLSQLGTKESADRLLGIALDRDESMDLRKSALFWAGQQREIDTEILLDLYGQGDREIKEQVIFVLSQRGDDEAGHALIRIAKEEKDTELRKNAIFWLGQMGTDEAIDFLEELINQ